MHLATSFLHYEYCHCFAHIIIEANFIKPTMEQCPICLRIFASSKYLVSHLHQSACRIALLPTNPDMVPTDTNSSNALPRSEEVPVVNDVVYRPMPVNAFGDFVVDAQEDTSVDDHPFFCDSDASVPDNIAPVAEVLANAADSGAELHADAPPFHESENTISFINDNESFNAPQVPDDKLIPMLKMIKAVRESGAPLVLLDNLIKIIKQEWQVGRLDITHLCTHKTALRRISKLFPSLPTPKTVTVTHERTRHELNAGMERPSVTFPRFSFLGQLQDLLDDHVFSDLKNLVVDPNNRWDHYKRNSCPHSVDEIQDGLWFQEIVQQFEEHNASTDSIKDFIIGVQGYSDKTGTDAYQRTTVEPLVFTLTLFTNEIRNQDKSWRVLALLPSSLSHKQRKKHSFGASVRNYHIALKQALAEFIELQRNPPIVRLRLGDEYQYVRARLFWVNTIADGLANESLTGRIQNRNNSPRLSRGCHCPQHLSDDATLSCNYLRQSAIERLSVAALGPLQDNCQQWIDYLESIPNIKERRAAESSLKYRKKIAQAILNNVFGQHVVDLVWFHVDQGPNPRGCFGSTPVDPMHAVEEGIIPNIMSVLLDPLPESAKAQLDTLALKIVACNRWDVEYPRMNFSGGFSSLTQLTADEKVGKMILLWIILQTTLGREVVDLRCDPHFDNQRVTRAARFIPKEMDKDDDDEAETSSQESNDSPDEYPLNANRRQFNGSLGQLQSVERCLRVYALDFVVPWIIEMIPCHQEILQRIVFQFDCAMGKGKKHELPKESFLDRHVVKPGATGLYVNGDTASTESRISGWISKEAECSVDCTSEQLQSLLEMVISFHASYKYALPSERENFDRNVRIMMSKIKSQVHQGKDTKNWAISKFHDLLHMIADSQNFGSHANVDAGKGEKGLKKWAKRPAKTVRTRDANHYYKDLATRIQEDRLIELATATMVPREMVTLDTPAVDSRDRESGMTIALLHPLMKLEVIGTSLLPEDLTTYLRARPNLVFPLQIYQEAKYSQNGVHQATIRGTPNYRNSGPWNDCVLISYENDTEGGNKEYPFQVHGFFSESGKETRLAFGKMGMHKKQNSKLLDEWSYEKNYRIVELETISRVVFALTIPLSCYRDNSDDIPHRMFVLKDRINEWPSIFDTSDWEGSRETGDRKRKRKRQK